MGNWIVADCRNKTEYKRDMKRMSATSPLCYVCHGDYCNDPFNTGKASVVNCSYSSGVNKRSVEDFETDVQNNSLASMESFKDWQSLESKFMGFFFNTDTDYMFNKVTGPSGDACPRYTKIWMHAPNCLVLSTSAMVLCNPASRVTQTFAMPLTLRHRAL
ncbi:hypothetical protein NQ318_017508 [Aromia moschata]|uniref:Uncharacterized protein n=1 Tax=Aromia moschata TaxID=1265417 RepID=A0AAV8XR41_9CUCU|nr:hypothetical protein NQ318_017508 [Aromia moschata]